VDNILARVTGAASTIDGTITATVGVGGPISSANLFLLNPAGVMFTANAQVNLGGSFAVSTANYARLGPNSTFYADVNHPIEDAGLSSAPVSAFGFLTATPQPVSFVGSQLSNAGGLHVIAGDITLNGANLAAPAGNITLFSAASAGEVPFSLASPGAGFASATNPRFGAVTIQNQSRVAIDGAGGGSVVIRGGVLTVKDSTVSSLNDGGVMGGPITVQAVTLNLQNGSFIGTDSETGATAGAGSVTVNVSGNATVTDHSQISADTETGSNGGTINATIGGNLTLNDFGNILANTELFAGGNGSSGTGGTITIHAASLDIGSGESGLNTLSAGSGNAGSIVADISGGLRMTYDGTITASAVAGGNGGSVQVKARNLTMIDTSLPTAAGPTITADTYGAGSGGTVNVDASVLTILGPGHLFKDGSSNFEVGIAGITAESVGQTGPAGSVTVKATDLTVGGGGGSVTVDCANGQLENQGEISSTSFINAGTVSIDASQSFSLTNDSTVTTSAYRNGGDITLKVGGLLYLLDSSFQGYAGVRIVQGQSTDVLGGNIQIGSQTIVLDDSLISANDLSPGGMDGNIANFSNFFFTSDSVLHATGTIETTSPDVQLGNDLLPLSKDLTAADKALRESCARSINHEFSTLVVVGRGGTETAPDELQADFSVDDAGGSAAAAAPAP
jgi:filamentous hemagglutinin family protein